MSNQEKRNEILKHSKLNLSLKNLRKINWYHKLKIQNPSEYLTPS